MGRVKSVIGRGQRWNMTRTKDGAGDIGDRAGLGRTTSWRGEIRGGLEEAKSGEGHIRGRALGRDRHASGPEDEYSSTASTKRGVRPGQIGKLYH